jgi:hypothetical protein
LRSQSESTIKTAALAIALISLLTLAHADDESSVEWVLLGPAASYHLSTKFAPETMSVQYACSTNTFAYNAPGPVSLANAGPILDSGPVATLAKLPTDAGVVVGTVPGTTWWAKRVGNTLQVTGCGDAAPRTSRSWHQFNPGVGIQVSSRTTSHTDLAYVDFVRDSLGSPSLMIGVGREWVLAHVKSVDLSAGIAAGAWWRSDVKGYANASDWDNTIYRHVVPVILPALSVRETTSGIGANLGFAPAARIGGRDLNNTPVILLQLTYRVR